MKLKKLGKRDVYVVEGITTPWKRPLYIGVKEIKILKKLSDGEPRPLWKIFGRNYTKAYQMAEKCLIIIIPMASIKGGAVVKISPLGEKILHMYGDMYKEGDKNG